MTCFIQNSIDVGAQLSISHDSTQKHENAMFKNKLNRYFFASSHS